MTNMARMTMITCTSSHWGQRKGPLSLSPFDWSCQVAKAGLPPGPVTVDNNFWWWWYHGGGGDDDGDVGDDDGPTKVSHLSVMFNFAHHDFHMINIKNMHLVMKYISKIIMASSFSSLTLILLVTIYKITSFTLTSCTCHDIIIIINMIDIDNINIMHLVVLSLVMIYTITSSTSCTW